MLPNVDTAPSICGWPFTRTRRSILLILLIDLPNLFSFPNSINFCPIISSNERRLHFLYLRSIHHISYTITDFLIENSSHFVLFLFRPPELPLQSIKTKLKVIMMVTYPYHAPNNSSTDFVKFISGKISGPLGTENCRVVLIPLHHSWQSIYYTELSSWENKICKTYLELIPPQISHFLWNTSVINVLP